MRILRYEAPKHFGNLGWDFLVVWNLEMTISFRNGPENLKKSPVQKTREMS